MARPKGEEPVCDGDLLWRDEIWRCGVGDGTCEEKMEEIWGEKGLEVGAVEGMDANTERAHEGKIVCWG
jgi:hypothetical protein